MEAGCRSEPSSEAKIPKASHCHHCWLPVTAPLPLPADSICPAPAGTRALLLSATQSSVPRLVPGGVSQTHLWPIAVGGDRGLPALFQGRIPPEENQPLSSRVAGLWGAEQQPATAVFPVFIPCSAQSRNPQPWSAQHVRFPSRTLDGHHGKAGTGTREGRAGHSEQPKLETLPSTGAVPKERTGTKCWQVKQCMVAGLWMWARTLVTGLQPRYSELMYPNIQL